MSVEEKRAMMLKAWELVSAGDIDAFLSLYSDNAIYHGSASEEYVGRDAIKASLSVYFDAFDLNATVEDTLAEGDRVFTRVRMEAANTGEFMGAPASGKTVHINWVMNLVRIEDGKVAEEWEIFDRMDMLSQLGLITDPAAALA